MRCLSQLQRAYKEAADIGRRLPMAPSGGGGAKPTAKQREALDHKYLQFLAAFVAKVNYLRPGEALVAPGGWRTGAKSGHAVMPVPRNNNNTFGPHVIANARARARARARAHAPYHRKVLFFRTPSKVLKNVEFYRGSKITKIL